MTKRTSETKEKIQQAFEHLLEEKAYEEITMEEIAQRAGRTRMTVYRHYADKEVLLLEYFGHVVEEMKDDIVYPQDPTVNGASFASYINLTVLYTHVARHRTLYRALFISPGHAVSRLRFRRIVVGVTLHTLSQEGTFKRIPAPIDLIANLLGEVIVGSVIWWLENNAKYDPALMAEIVLRLSESGLFGFTGQTPTPLDASYRPFSLEQRPNPFK